MSKVRKIILILLCVCLIVTSIPFGFAAYNENNFINSDSENFVDGLVYGVHTDKGFVYSGKSDSADIKYYTNYKVTQLAVYEGYIYVTSGKALRKINIENKQDTLIYTSDYYLGKFALSPNGIYILENKSIILLNDGKTSYVINSDKITDFWLDSVINISYVTTDKIYIYTLNLVTGKESTSYNFISSFDEGVPIYDKSSGSAPSGGSITTLYSKFPAGQYWNHVNGGGNNPDKYTSTPCGHHSGGCDYTGGCGCNSFSSAIQCMGYAFKCGYDVYGSSPRNWTTYTSSTSLNNVKPGDVIRYRNDGHSIFVIGVSGDTIKFTDCNWSGNCNIRWNQTVSKSTVRSSFTKLYSAPYSAPGGTDDPAVYTITFNANGGSVSPSSFKIYSGNSYGDMPIPERTGYSFDGWYTQASGGARIKESDVCTGSQTLYAHWTVRVYTVTFNANGGSGTLPATITFEHGSNGKIGAAKPTRNGFTFKEWNTKADGSGTSYTPGQTYRENADATLYAIWNGKKYTVYFYSGTSNVGSKTVTCGDEYGDLIDPTTGVHNKEGYDFLGWYLESSFTTKITESSTVTTTEHHQLYAKWEEATYKITYNANGGSGAPSTQYKKYFSDIYLSKTIPTKTGNNFICWKDDKGNTYNPGSKITTNADLDLVAIWDPIKYPVKFDANGGINPPDSISKEYGNTLTLPETVPTKEGFDFVCWNTKLDGSGTKYNAGSKYTDNSSLTLYAQWETAKYRITYNADGGLNAPETQIKIYNETIKLSGTVPTKTGHIFRGWSDGTSIYTPNQAYTINAHLALKAVWEREKYEVSYIANGGSGTMAKQTKEYGINLILSSCAFTKYGYKCVKWNTKPDGSGTSYAVSGNYTGNTPITLYAIWAPESYTVNYDTGFYDVVVASNICTFDSPYGTLPIPKKPGYTFNGWFNAKEGGTQYTGAEIHKTANSITMYAHWTANVYKVTFDTGVSAPASFTKEITFDTNYGDIAPTPRDGYIFAGWFTEKNGDIEIKSSTKMTTPQDHTLYASWVKKAVVVTLDTDGGYCESVSVSYSDSTTYGTLPTPQKPGYKFTGWYYNGNKVSQSTNIINSNHTLVANWSAQSYTITYDANGGTSNTTSSTVKYGSAITSMPTATKAGYEFIGWYDQNGIEYTNGKIFDKEENITLTAKYAQTESGYIIFIAKGNTVAKVSTSDLPQSKPTVPQIEGYLGKWDSYSSSSKIVKAIYTPKAYNLNFVIDGSITNYTLTYGSKINVPSVTAPSGYVFTGWDSPIPATMPNKDLTITAKFSSSQYVITFIADGKFVGAVGYKSATDNVTPPPVPQKIGYDYYWNNFTLTNSNLTVFAYREYTVYTATFKAKGEIVGTRNYTIATENIIPPSVPDSEGYTGMWEGYTLTPGGITINAIYKANTYYVTFMANGQEVARVAYLYGAKSVAEPEIPERIGYEGKWPEYVLGAQNITVNAVYTKKPYYITFIADGQVVDKVKFNYGDKVVIEPPAPSKDGFIVSWPNYELGASDITVYTDYTCISVIVIYNFTSTRTETYRTTLSFRAGVLQNAPENYEIHWFVNGVDMGKGNDNNQYTVKEARSDYSIKAVLFYNGKAQIESPTEKVEIKDTFMQKFIAFFKALFRRLPNKVQ